MTAMLFQPSDYTWPPLPPGVRCIRCGEHYDPDEHKQCPECYAPCDRCGDWLSVADIDRTGRCAVCIEEEKS